MAYHAFRQSSFFVLLMVGVSLGMAPVAWGEESAEKAMEQDRKQIEGTWRVVSLTMNGNQAQPEDAEKLAVVNTAGGKWSLHADGHEIAKGTSTFDPKATPKSIDFTITEGNSAGKQFVGIYELQEDTRKLCFGPTEIDRPKEFAAPEGSQFILVSFERVKPSGDSAAAN